jgi:predicted ATP-dependent serine protease
MRLPDRWAGRELDHAPRIPRVVSAYEVRARRSVRRPSGEMLGKVFGPTIPSSGWSLVVTGPPSSGKTTWTLKVLESGVWERPVMVAAEEGVDGIGLADRVEKLEITKVRFSDAQNVPEITTLLESADPDVLALDSASALGLEPEDVLVLRRGYPRTTFIVIVQVTKAGAHKGSMGWKHDVDAFISFREDHTWLLEKSWFSESGKTGGPD